MLMGRLGRWEVGGVEAGVDFVSVSSEIAILGPGTLTPRNFLVVEVYCLDEVVRIPVETLQCSLIAGVQGCYNL